MAKKKEGKKAIPAACMTLSLSKKGFLTIYLSRGKQKNQNQKQNKKTPAAKPDKFFFQCPKICKFINKPQSEQNCKYLTNHCVPLDQSEHLLAFPIFGLVPSGFAQIVVVIFPCPVNVYPGRQ